MAAITSYTSYLTELAGPYQRIQDSKNSITTVAGQPYSSWVLAPQSGLIPSTSVACDKNTTGAENQQNSNVTQYIAQIAASQQSFGQVILIDRLSHQGGLSGVVSVSAVTTNLPTVLPTRYTGSYAGTMAAIEIYTQIGNTQVVLSGSYVNQDGATSSFQPISFGATGVVRAINRFAIIPLQNGDTGVQQVLNVVLSNTTGTAGNYGITIFRPIMVWNVPDLGAQQVLMDAITSNAMQLEQIQNNACLQYVFISGTTTTGIYQSVIRTIEA